MPELPEIETVKRQLEKHLVGLTISALRPLHPKSAIGNPDLVKGKKVVRVERRGKLLIIDLGGRLSLAVHFKMSGQLVLDKNGKIKNQNAGERIAGGHPTADWVGDLPGKHTRAVFEFTDGSRMYFNDQRIFGWIKILPDNRIRNLEFLQKLGPEPWDMNPLEFINIFQRKKAVKLTIMDQEIVSGAGNIYANDSLWEARLHPETPANRVTAEQAGKLHQALIKVLREGIKYGGATAADDKYVNLEGLGGKYQEHFRVYDREGKQCLRKDGGVIRKITLGGRGTYFCPVCQKRSG